MLGLAGFGGYVVMGQQAALNEAQAIGGLVDIAPTISNVAHELQKERGRSAGYLGSDGDASYRSALEQQFQETDAALAAYHDVVATVLEASSDSTLSGHAQEVEELFHDLGGVREAILASETDVPTMAGHYGTTITVLIEEIEDIGKLSQDGPLTEALVGYAAFLQGKEFAGQERAMGANGFAAGVFTPQVYQRFIKLIGMQDALFELFVHHSDKEFGDAYHAFEVGAAALEVDRMRAIGLAGGLGEDMSSVTGATWFDAATMRIEELKAIEDAIGASLQARVDVMQESAGSAFAISLAVAIALIAATGLLVFVGVRSITRPVASLTGAMTALANGDNTVDVPATAQRDEIGEMARAVEVFKNNAVEMEAMRAEQAAQEERARQEALRSRNEMADTFEASVGGVVSALTAAAGQMQGSAKSMSSTAQQTADLAGAVAAASEEASTSVQTVASATEQMASSVTEIASQVGKSHTIASDAVGQAKRTNEQVRGLVDAVQKIGDVVELISAIAEQTNLLALNATIEAARAGDAGKGFAVVASEVKSLATQTAKATSQISEQINGIQTATTDAATAIEAIGTIIEEMSGISSSVAAAVEEQDAATSEITRSIREAAAGTEQVATNISGVGEAAGQTGHAASEVLEAANGLTAEADRLRGEVASFLANVRGAA